MLRMIAEFGVNWENREQAFFMMGQAFTLGIKYIKFQMFPKETVSADLQHMFMTEELAKELVETGKQYGQEVFFTPMYPEAVDLCEKIGVNYYKIRYFDRNNLIIYRKLKQTEKTPIFVSCDSKNPKDTIYYNMAKYQERVSFLFCVPNYPAKYNDYRPLRNLTNFDGISDHTPDLELFKYFYVLEQTKPDSIKWFEMHMCLDDNGYERKWSKTFEELKEVIEVLK